MGTTPVHDIDGQRTMEIGTSPHLPGSVFLTTRDACYEFDKNILLNALFREFRLFEEIASPDDLLASA